MTFEQMVLMVVFILLAAGIGFLNDRSKRTANVDKREKKWYSHCSWLLIAGAIGVGLAFYKLENNGHYVWLLIEVFCVFALLTLILFQRRTIWFLIKSITSVHKIRFAYKDKSGNTLMKCPNCSSIMTINDFEMKRLETIVCEKCGEILTPIVQNEQNEHNKNR